MDRLLYPLVVVDPPWEFSTYSAKGKGKSPEQHYACMSLADLESVGACLEPHLAKDAILLLWAVDPLLPEAVKLGESWGFRYKTVAFTWTKRTKHGKEHMGCGYYTRANPELCLLFRRGQRAVPVRDRGVRQWIDAPVGRHSAKPEESYARIERLFGDVPRMELFARVERPGWTTLGYDLDGQDIRDRLKGLP